MVQSGELGFGSGPPKNPYSGRKWRTTNHWVEESHPCPHQLFLFHQLGNRWKDLLAKNAEKKRESGVERWKKKNWHILNESKACLFIWGRSGSNFFSPIMNKCALRQRLAPFNWFSYAFLAFGMFVYEACEMDSVRLCGGRWWGYWRMWKGAGKVGTGRAAVCVLHVEGSPSCSCLPFRCFRSWVSGWDGIGRHWISPAVVKVESPINEVLKTKIRSKWKVREPQTVTHHTFETVAPSVLLNCSNHDCLCWMMMSCVPIYVNHTTLCFYNQYKWQSPQCCSRPYFLLPSLFSTSCHLLSCIFHRL